MYFGKRHIFAALAAFSIFAPRPVFAINCLSLLAGGNWKESLQLAGSPSPVPAHDLFERVVLPVLQESDMMSATDVVFKGNSVVLTDTEGGKYTFSLVHDPNNEYPKEGVPEIQKTKNGKLTSQVRFGVRSWDRNLTDSQGLVRSALRRSPLHLFNTNRPGRRRLAYSQIRERGKLLSVEMKKNPNSDIFRAIVAPMGYGKTTLGASYIRALGQLKKSESSRGWKKAVKTLVVIEDGRIIDQDMSTVSREMGYTKEARYFGRSAHDPIDSDAEIIGVTRSTLKSRLEEFIELMAKDPDQPWVILGDEFHHWGKEAGQFEAILTRIQTLVERKKIGHRIRLLFLSATPWHLDKPIIKKYLKGRVFAPFLRKHELQVLNAGDREQLLNLVRVQMVRGIQEGYLKPIDSLHLIDEVEGRPVDEYLFKNAESRRSRITSVSGHEPLLNDMSLRINAGTEPGVFDRRLFYFPNTSHAELYANPLSQTVGPFFPYHSFLTDVERRKITAGFEGDLNAHLNLGLAKLHNEGSDMDVNAVVLGRRFSDTESGFRALLQNIGRGLRISARFSGLRVYDYSGFSRQLLSDLPKMTPEPLLGQPTQDRPGDFVFNEKPVTRLSFQTEVKDFDLGFLGEFPYYKAEEFQKGAMRVLHKEIYRQGLDGDLKKLNPQDFFLKLAEGLEGKDVENYRTFVKSIDWIKGGLSSALYDLDSAAERRFYAAYFRFCDLLKSRNPSSKIDLERVHETDMAELVFEERYPRRAPWMTKLADKKSFAAPGGVMDYLDEVAVSLGFSSIQAGYNARDVSIAIAKRAEISEDIISEISKDSWGWRKRDGRTADLVFEENSTGFAVHKERYQKIYRVLYLVARSLAERGHNVDPEKMHKVSEVRKMLKILFPDGLSKPMSKEKIQSVHKVASLYFRFRNRFGVDDWTIKKNFQPFLLSMAKRIPEREARKQAIKDLSDEFFALEDLPGTYVPGTFEERVKVFHRGLTRIASAMNECGYAINVSDLHKTMEAKRLMDLLLYRRAIPRLSDRIAKDIGSDAGAIHVLRTYPYRFGVTVVTQDYGMSELLVEMAKKLKDKKLSRSLQDRTVWGFQKSDGEKSGGGAIAASHRIYTALYAIAAQFNEESGDGPKIDLKKLHTPAECYKLLSLLSIGVAVPYLTNREAKEFGSGALQLIFDQREAFGFPTGDLSRIPILRDIAKKTAKLMKSSPELRRVVKEINSDRWNWAKSDFQQARRSEKYFHHPAQKTFAAYYALAYIEAQQNDAADWDLTRLYDYDEFEKFLFEVWDLEYPE